MPNIRENLIELIEESTGVTYGGEYGDVTIQEEIDISDEEIERIADHLIAHGVTVQDWISVKDRLPEEMEWVMCACVDNEVHLLRYDYIMDDWDIQDRTNSCYGKGFVTHWMPLPQPPKGE